MIEMVDYDKMNYLGKKDDDRLVRKFFIMRFHKEPETDWYYYLEWVRRFESGNPTKWMDSQSKKVYVKIMSE